MDGEFLQKYRRRRDRKESYEKKERGYLSVSECVCVCVEVQVTEKQAEKHTHTFVHLFFSFKVETFLSAPSLTVYG